MTRKFFNIPSDLIVNCTLWELWSNLHLWLYEGWALTPERHYQCTKTCLSLHTQPCNSRLWFSSLSASVHLSQESWEGSPCYACSYTKESSHPGWVGIITVIIIQLLPDHASLSVTGIIWWHFLSTHCLKSQMFVNSGVIVGNQVRPPQSKGEHRP